MYEDLPDTRRLVALVTDVALARSARELELEEELYWALINIYRSPAVLFRLTTKPGAAVEGEDGGPGGGGGGAGGGPA